MDFQELAIRASATDVVLAEEVVVVEEAAAAGAEGDADGNSGSEWQRRDR